jgi:hypothetical protein
MEKCEERNRLEDEYRRAEVRYVTEDSKAKIAASGNDSEEAVRAIKREQEAGQLADEARRAFHKHLEDHGC